MSREPVYTPGTFWTVRATTEALEPIKVAYRLFRLEHPGSTWGQFLNRIGTTFGRRARLRLRKLGIDPALANKPSVRTRSQFNGLPVKPVPRVYGDAKPD